MKKLRGLISRAAIVLQTKNYDMFELLPFNRDVKKTAKLKRSMQRYGFRDGHPITVVRIGNGKFRIKMGHHRFDVARELGIAVKFVVEKDDGPNIYEAEDATNRWTFQDYLASYVRLEKPAYAELQRYHRETGIPLNHCISLLAGESAGSHNQHDKFKAGEFTLGDQRHAKAVADVVRAFKAIGASFAANSFLVQAVSKVVWVEEFDIRTMKQKIAAHPYLAERQANADGYLEMIQRIYNRQSSSKVALKFLAEEKAKERSAAPRPEEARPLLVRANGKARSAAVGF